MSQCNSPCLRAALVLLFWIAAVDFVQAATFRIDDAGSVVQQPTARLQWRQLAPGRRPDSTLEGAITVAVRLNLAQWLKRNGRIYLVLPEQPIGVVRAAWTSQGRLIAGQIASGQRTLVYTGPITTPLLEETMVFRIEADGDRLVGVHQLGFHFEIDLD